VTIHLQIASFTIILESRNISNIAMSDLCANENEQDEFHISATHLPFFYKAASKKTSVSPVALETTSQLLTQYTNIQMDSFAETSIIASSATVPTDRENGGSGANAYCVIA